jgi:hypothetical protein
MNKDDKLFNDSISPGDIHRDFVSLLNHIDLEKSLTNYFFIFINVILIITNTLIISPNISFNILIGYNAPIISILVKMYPSIILFFIEISLNYYWLIYHKELNLIHEMRYKILFRFESKYSYESLLKEEWLDLGRIKNRRSPVFTSRFIERLPQMFILMHAVQFFLSILINVR